MLTTILEARRSLFASIALALAFSFVPAIAVAAPESRTPVVDTKAVKSAPAPGRSKAKHAPPKKSAKSKHAPPRANVKKKPCKTARR